MSCSGTVVDRSAGARWLTLPTRLADDPRGVTATYDRNVTIRRRDVLRAAVVGAGAFAFDPVAFAGALTPRQCAAPAPYGPLGDPDANGIRLPRGFTSRVIGITGLPVAGTLYPWHVFPDGGATFALAGGGWVYTSNSEVPGTLGGVGSVSFDAQGQITGARQILAGTSTNCAGGPTPWGTWLSGEELDRGQVWECDPLGRRPGVARPAMGRFQHEAVAVDDARRTAYLTEDVPDGCFYRFRYRRSGDLSAGQLEVASVRRRDGSVRWIRVPDPAATSTRTRHQVTAATHFNGGEGIWYGRGFVHFTTKGDNRVWRYDVRRECVTVLYDIKATCNPVLSGVDNVVMSRSGDLFVAEDGGDMQIVILGADKSISPIVQVTGQEVSEITGPAFSPDGRRLYFSSQRGGPTNLGITYEVMGPFRR